ncbi:MAG: hypothetical protein PHW72_01610 [Candidatus Pacebacteria bacterium]|nr:hypothetical protein [Candidatus Paceibacterota bacterium]
MVNNEELFKFSLNNPEPIIDDFYLKKGNLIISQNPNDPTTLMKRNFNLLESISAYNFAKKNKNQVTAKKAIETIIEIVKGKDINYSEFVSFWPVVDISYSLFEKMEKADQLKIIKNIVEKYIELRHNLYSVYNYSPTTLQVGKDAKAHKENGNLGAYKISKILNSAGFVNADSDTVKQFTSVGNKKYIETDKKGKRLFKDLIIYYKLKFLWSRSKEKKMPDFLIKDGKNIFIVEHKHMKECGGGQDKQINEIISFISFSERNQEIHYVSFLDGIYFNLFTKDNLNECKVRNQLNSIKKSLKNNKQNYFLNTAGFKKLFNVWR